MYIAKSEIEEDQSIESYFQTVGTAIERFIAEARNRRTVSNRQWISMNENTTQYVTETNSDMNNSLIIGKNFFFYLARAFIGFFPSSKHSSLSLSLSFRIIREEEREESEFPLLLGGLLFFICASDLVS